MKPHDLLVIHDGDTQTALSEDILSRIEAGARAEGLDLRIMELKRRQAPPCTGCLRCLTRPPFLCVYTEAIAPLIREAADCPTVIYLSPAPFGTLSSTIKNIVDRGGLIVRNHETCRQIVIGCGQDATDEERSTFIDIIARHRGTVDIVHPDRRENFEVYFTRSEDESRDICERIVPQEETA